MVNSSIISKAIKENAFILDKFKTNPRWSKLLFENLQDQFNDAPYVPDIYWNILALVSINNGEGIVEYYPRSDISILIDGKEYTLIEIDTIAIKVFTEEDIRRILFNMGILPEIADKLKIK